MTVKLGASVLSFLSITSRPDLVISPPRSSFVNAWQMTMKIHEVIAENRLRFASRLNEMSEELANLAKEVDKNRKAVCRRLCSLCTSRPLA